MTPEVREHRPCPIVPPPGPVTGPDRLPLTGIALLAAMLAVAAVPGAAGAQSLRGTVLARGSGEPIGAAFATLRRVDGGRVDAGLTGEDGTFVLQADSEGRYRLRVERIGFETWTSSPFELNPGSTLSRRFRVPVRPVTLGTISVEAGRRCRNDLAQAEAAHRLWTEARKALSVRSFTESRRRYRFDTRRRVRVVDRTPRRVLVDSTSTRSDVAGSPFRSAPADSLAEHGWVQPAGGDHLYFGPDAGALLADAFRETHCFSVAEPGAAPEHLAPSDAAGSGLVGLAFEPVPGRAEPDIRGVLWLDRTDGSLRELVFRYTWIPADASPAPYGGRVRFRELEDGSWIVQRWRLRVPNVTTVSFRTPGASRRHRSPNVVKTVQSRVVAVHRDTASGAGSEPGSGVDAGSAALRLDRVGFLERRRQGRGRHLGPSQLREMSNSAAADRIRDMWSWSAAGCEAGAALYLDGERRQTASGRGLLPTGEVVLAVEAYGDGASTPAPFGTTETCGALLIWTASPE